MMFPVSAAGYSIKQHLMASYVGSLFAICMAQCMQFKCEPGGKQGVEQLAQSPQIQLYFASTGRTLSHLSSLVMPLSYEFQISHGGNCD